MKAKHEEIFKQFTATFPVTIVKEWTEMVERWEGNASQPNPYMESESGKIIITGIMHIM